MNNPVSELTFAADEETAKKIADRSFAYGTLAACLDYPDQLLIDAIGSGQLLEGLTGIYADDLNKADCSGLATSVTVTVDDLKAEYMRLFEVGGPKGSRCSLFGGHYYGERLQVMEEHVRFYNYFKLHMPDRIEELPDHLGAELEFLRFLSTNEACALRQHEPTESLCRAERDFIRRHPMRWIGQLHEAVARHATLPFYPALVQFISQVLVIEANRLSSVDDDSSIPVLDAK